MKRPAGFILCACLVVIFAFAVHIRAENHQQGAKILDLRCTGCHGLDIIMKESRSAAEWEQTVDRMIRIGARVTQDEKGILIEYLGQTFP